MDQDQLAKKVAEVTAGHRMAGLPITAENEQMVEDLITGKLTSDQALE